MGLNVPGMSWKQVRDTAVLVEQLGYSCISLGESWGGDAFTSLAQLATVTSRIRIGTSIVPVYGRSSANLAMTAINMDVMSDGRFFLGIGASGKSVIEGLHGESFRKPVTRIREYIDVIRQAMRGERLDHEGEFVHTQRFRLRINPYRDNLPIYVASLSPASLRMTGELADGWLPIYLAPTRMNAILNQLRVGATLAGRSLDEIKISPQVSIYVTEDTGSAYERERSHLAFYIGGMGISYHRYMHTIGFGRESDNIREAYIARDRERAAKLVTDEMVHATAIVGTPQQCRDQMQLFFDAGVDEIRLVFNEPNPDLYLQSLKAVAPNG